MTTFRDAYVGLLRELVDVGPLDWRKSALCVQVDAELFFPQRGGSSREAKRICAHCDVRQQCLDFALTHGEWFGIWGGLSERERRRLVASRRTRDAAASDGTEGTATRQRDCIEQGAPARREVA